MPKLEVVNANNVIEYSPQKANFKLKNTGGPKGEPGAQGPKGDTGPQGPAGPQGIQGEKGEKGAQGERGPQGIQGPQGPQGIQGPKGDKGDKGNTGATGPQGPQGPAGQNGTDGQDGADGFSPIATVTQEGLDAEISITDKDGTTTATVPGFGVQTVATLPATGTENVIYLKRTESTASGNPISIADAVEAPLADFKLKGETSQQTYTGKNLFNAYKITTGGGSVVKTVDSDGVIWLSNNSYNNGYYSTGITLATFAPKLVAGQTYYIYVVNSFQSGGRDYIYLSGSSSFWNTGKSHTVTQAELEGGVVVYGGYQATTSLKIMITTTADTNWEKYVGGVPAPNPDYPQAVQTVTGENVVRICGKNLFDKSKATLGYRIGGDGTPYADSPYFISDFIPVKANTAYHINTANVGGSSAIATYDKDKVFIRRILGDGYQNIVTDANALYVRFATSQTVIDQAQLEQGSTATTYEPYEGQSYEVNLGKNLFDKDNASGLFQGYISGGKAWAASGYWSYYIPCQPNTTYTASRTIIGNGGRFAIATSQAIPASNVDVAQLTQDNTATSLTITTNSSAKYIIVWFANVNDAGSESLADWEAVQQLEKGSQATSYAAYFTPIELCKIGTYQDYIYKSDGKWYVHKETNKVTLDGTEPNWATQTSGGYKRYSVNRTDSKSFSGRTSDVLLSSHFTPSITDAVGIVFVADKTYYFYPAQTITTVDSWKDWLSNNMPSLYYQLATPTDTEITNVALIAQLEAILSQGYTYAGTNNITTVIAAGNTQGELEVGYYNAYDSYLYVAGRWQQFARLTAANE